MTWILLALLPAVAYLGFRLGERRERGRKEKARDALEEQRFQRGIRGTVRLSPIKIRR